MALAIRSAAQRFGCVLGILVIVSACTSTSTVTSTSTLQSTGTTVAYLNAKPGLASDLPFSEAVQVDNLLFLSGQIGSIPGKAQLVKGGIGPETRQTLQNINSTLKRHGYSMNDLVKCTVMLADMAEWSAFNEVYRTFFADHFPARSAFGVQGLAYGARVEIECIGAR